MTTNIQKTKRVTLHMELVISEDDYNEMINAGESLDNMIEEFKREFSNDPKIAVDVITLDVKDDPIVAGTV
jgi:hypothetical protein